MMVFLTIIVFWLNAQSSVSDYRLAYEKQDEVQILKQLNLLESKKARSSDEECYYAAFLCLKAKFSNNPYTKYNSFSKGYRLLNELITKQSSNVEYRYHRYMVETKAPSFLIETSHVAADKAFIKQNLKSDHPIYHLINKTID